MELTFNRLFTYLIPYLLGGISVTLSVSFLALVIGAVGGLLLAFLRGSGALELAERLLSPAFRALGLPVELLPFLVMRPVSGSGSLSALQDLIARLGVDAQAARMAAALMGSSETTLYVVALYLGSVRMRTSRYCVTASLISTVFGAFFALLSLNLL